MTGGFGAFGKMPSVGDFFRLNAPAGFVQVWDEWIQKCLMSGAQTLGQAWDAHFMSAPIWRFCLSPGLAGPHKMIGVLMPSVDRVGRRFPLTLMSPLETGGSALLTHFRQDALFARAENLALLALEDDMTRDRLAEGLAELPAPVDGAAAELRGFGTTVVMTPDPPSVGVAPDLAAGLLNGQFHHPSVWSTEIDGAPRLMICEGLPAGPDMQGLFDLYAATWTEARPL